MQLIRKIKEHGRDKKQRERDRGKETEGKEYAGHLISGRKCGRMKNTHKIRGEKKEEGIR